MHLPALVVTNSSQKSHTLSQLHGIMLNKNFTKFFFLFGQAIYFSAG